MGGRLRRHDLDRGRRIIIDLHSGVPAGDRDAVVDLSAIQVPVRNREEPTRGWDTHVRHDRHGFGDGRRVSGIGQLERDTGIDQLREALPE